MISRGRFMLVAWIVAAGWLAGAVPAARAQSFAGLCVGTASEGSPQCQALKTADQRVKSAQGKVPVPNTTLIGRGQETATALVCSGNSALSQATTPIPPECAEWKEAVEARTKAAAAVEALKRSDIADATPTASQTAAAAAKSQPSATAASGAQPAPVTTPSSVGGGVLPVIRVPSGEQVALVGKPMRLEGMVGNDAGTPKLRINGQPATLFEPRSGSEPVAKNSFAFRVDVPTQAAGTQIYVLEACDGAGNCVGTDMVVHIVASDGPSIKGRNYALVIGNNEYKNLPRLKTAVADAKAVAEMLKARYAFDDASVKLLLNADRNAILGELAQLRTTLTPDDRLLIYYAGHGQIDQAANEGFWQPIDAQVNADYTWISNGDLRRNLRGMSAKHVLVVADSCFSGSLTRSAPRQTPGSDRFFAQIDGHFSRKVITSGGDEPVADSGTGDHSVFAHYFLKALKENSAPYITSFELFNALARAVTNNSSQKPEYGTIGNAGDEGAGDFTFILKN